MTNSANGSERHGRASFLATTNTGRWGALSFSADAYNAAFLRELPQYDLRERISDVRVPTLLVVGANDWYRPAMEWLAAHLPAATLHVIEEAGHFPFIEAEGEFVNAVSGFLSDRDDLPFLRCSVSPCSYRYLRPLRCLEAPGAT